jgi:hypothetical protein
LGEEGEEEESSFGIEKVDEDALAEDASEAMGHSGGNCVSGCSAEKCAEAEENQIESTGELDDVKGACG